MEIKEGQVNKFQRTKGYESFSRNFLQDENISDGLRGLLCKMQSYPENFKIIKTKIINGNQVNKRSAMEKIWNEGVDKRYIVEMKKRGDVLTRNKQIKNVWVYSYLFQLDPFTIDDIQNIQEKNPEWQLKDNEALLLEINNRPNPRKTNDSSNVDFQQQKFYSSKPAGKDLLNKDLLDKDKISDTVSDTELKKANLPVENISDDDVNVFLQDLTDTAIDYQANPFLTPGTIRDLKMWQKATGQYGVAKKIKDLIFQTKRTTEKKYGSGNDDNIELSQGSGIAEDLETLVKRVMREIHQADQLDNPIKSELGYWNRALTNFWEVAYMARVNYNADYIPDGIEYQFRKSPFQAMNLMEEATIQSQALSEQQRYFYVKWKLQNGDMFEGFEGLTLTGDQVTDLKQYLWQEVSNLRDVSNKEFEETLDQQHWWKQIQKNLLASAKDNTEFEERWGLLH